MEKLYLIYINSVGKDWQGNYLYEFLYSNTIKDIDGNDWDAVPAANRPEPPHEEFVKKVGKLTRAQLEDIAKQKEPDLNSNDIDAAVLIIAGTARSMGVEVDLWAK